MNNFLHLRNPDFIIKLEPREKTLFCIFAVLLLSVYKIVRAVCERLKTERNDNVIKGVVFVVYHRLVENLWGYKVNNNSYSKLIDLSEDESRELLDKVTGLIVEFFNINQSEMSEALKVLQENEDKPKTNEGEAACGYYYRAATLMLNNKVELNLHTIIEISEVLAINFPAFDATLKELFSYHERDKEDLIVDFFNNFYRPENLKEQ